MPDPSPAPASRHGWPFWCIMRNRHVSYWRAFLTTGAMVGTLNLAYLIYFVTLPVVTIFSKGDDFQGRKPIELLETVVITVNIPGVIVFAIPFFTRDVYPDDTRQRLLQLLVIQACGTLFWALFGVLIEWWRKPDTDTIAIGTPAPHC